MICYSTAYATSYQVKPSEYVYHGDSVNGVESPSANCMNYPAGPSSQQYIHCDGTQLLLVSDSNFGSEQYQTNEYYQWGASPEKNRQLLFIFPTRVSLTTITLHYYSDNFQGLPRLRFYAVPDDFDIWDAPTTRYPQVNIAVASYPGREARRGGGEKAAWYLLHAHAQSTLTKPGTPNTTVYFQHFPPVYVSKLLRVIQMNYAMASQSTDWRVSYAPTDDATSW